MPFTIAREIKINGSEAYVLQSGDKVQIKVKDEMVINYEVPQGRSGNITITITGSLTDLS